MEALETLKKQYVDGLSSVNKQVTQLTAQLENLSKQREQLVGAIYALDTLSASMVQKTEEPAKEQEDVPKN